MSTGLDPAEVSQTWSGVSQLILEISPPGRIEARNTSDSIANRPQQRRYLQQAVEFMFTRWKQPSHTSNQKEYDR